jgi:hypothetical protein
MANCFYYINGEQISEIEFKKLLNEGLLDQLISQYGLEVPGFTVNESLVGTTQTAPGAKHISSTVLRKVNRQHNTSYIPNEQGGITKDEEGKIKNEWSKSSPQVVIDKANAEIDKANKSQTLIKRQKVDFIIGIKDVNGDIKTNISKKFNKNLRVNANDHMETGIPYLFVPSAYGLYPIRLRSEKIESLKNVKEIEGALKKIAKAKSAKEVVEEIKLVKEYLYQIDFIPTATGIKVHKKYTDLQGNEATEEKSFSTKEGSKFIDYIKDQIAFVDIKKINTEGYNKMISEQGRITTNLFSENGNFFNSSSIILAGYGATLDEKGVSNARTYNILKPDFEEANEIEEKVAEVNAANKPNPDKNRPDEGEEYGAPFEDLVDGVQAASVQESDEDILAGYEIDTVYTYPNSNKPRKARVVAEATDKGLTVTSILLQNNKGEYVKPTSKQLQNINKRYWADPKIKALKEKYQPVVKPAKQVGASKVPRMDVAQENSADLDDFLATLKEKGIDGSKADDKDVNNASDEKGPTGTLRSTKPEEKGEVWSEEQKNNEITFLQKKISSHLVPGNKNAPTRLGMFNTLEDLEEYLPQELYAQLLEARRHGHLVHGLFTNAAMYLSDNAFVGTGYHEAFHVVFGLTLNYNQRLDILQEAREAFRDELEARFGDQALTYNNIEEFLADKFMDYTQTAEATEKDLPQKIKNYFKGIYRGSKLFFSKNRVLTIDGLFEDINLAVYKDKANFKNTNVSEFKPRMTMYQAYENPIEAKEAMEFLVYKTKKYLINTLESEKKKKKNARNPKLDTTDISTIANTLGKANIINHLMETVSHEMVKANEIGNANHANRLKALLDVLADGNISDSAFISIGENGLEYVADSPFMNEFFLEFKREEGIKFSENILDAKEKEKEDIDEVDLEELGEYEDFAESWQNHYMQFDPVNSLNTYLKIKLGNFLKKNPKTGEPEVNSFGAPVTYNKKNIYNELSFYITDSRNEADMMKKLNAIANSEEDTKPYIKDLINELDSRAEFKSQLFLGLGALTRDNFLTFRIDRNGERSLFYSNRKTVDALIKDNFMASVLYQGNPLYNNYPKGTVKAGQSNFNDINQEEVKRLRESFKELLNIKAPSKLEEGMPYLEALSDFFGEMGINISSEQLMTAWNPTNRKDVRSEWDTIKKIINNLDKVLRELEQGNNPFTVLKPTEEKTKASKREGNNPIENIVRLLKPGMEMEVVNAFRNAEGKNMYAVHLSNMLKQKLSEFKDKEQLKKYLKKVESDPFLSNLPFIKSLYTELENGEIELTNVADSLESAVFDAFSKFGKYQKVDYKALNDQEMMDVRLTAFNNQGDHQFGYFMLPIPADSTNIPLLKMEKLTKAKIKANLLEVAKGERKRILLAKSLTESDPLYYHETFPTRGQEFVNLKFLNTPAILKIVEDQTKVIPAIEAAINDYIDNVFMDQQLEYFKNIGVVHNYNTEAKDLVLHPDVQTPMVSKRLRERLEIDGNDMYEVFESYLLNNWFNTLQMNLLFNKEAAFYKTTEDYSKRAKQVVSPGQYNSATNRTVRALFMEDEFSNTAEDTLEHIKSLLDRELKKGNISKNKAKEILAKWELHTKSDKYQHNHTDGATFVSIDFRVAHLRKLGQLTPAHEAAAKRIKEGTEDINDIGMFPPRKPYAATEVVVNNKGYNIVVPLQIKTAEFVITKSFAERRDKDGNLMYPILSDAYNILNDYKEHGIDMIPFVSAGKVGAIGQEVVIENGKRTVKFAKLEKDDEGYGTYLNDNIVEFKASDWREQQKTPNHYIDEDAQGNLGSQFRHIVIGDHDPTLTEEVKEYQDLIVQNLKESFEKQKKFFLDENGKVDYVKLSELIKREVEERDLGDAYKQAVELVTNSIGEENVPALPYFHPAVNNKIMAILNSVFKNKITKQKIFGGAVVNTPSFDTASSLKWHVDKDTGAVTMEALLPWASRKYFPIDSKTGQVDLSVLPQELKEMIGYRIPTEHKYSIFNIVVKGFTDPAMGPTLILPPEATTIAGLDFDIDKLYMIMANYYLTYNSKTKEYDLPKYITPITNKKDFVDFYSRMPNNLVKIIDELAPDGVTITNKDGEEVFYSGDALRNRFKEIYKENIAYKKLSHQLNHSKNEIQSALIRQKMDEILDEDPLTVSDFLNKNAEETKKVLEQIIKKNKIKDFKKFNTRKQRDNRILELSKKLMSGPKTALGILDYGSFDNLKIHGLRIQLLKQGDAKTIKAVNKIDAAFKKTQNSIKYLEDLQDLYNATIDSTMDPNLPSTQNEFYRRNMAGVSLTGVFANHAIHHIKSQFVEEFQVGPEHTLYFNDTSYYNFKREFSEEILPGTKNYVSKTLATFVAGILDNAKDPISDKLNFNLYTADMIAALTRMGMDEQTAFTFINTAPVIEATNLYFQNPSKASKVPTVNQLTKALLNRFQVLYPDASLIPDDLSLSTKELEGALIPNDSIESMRTQFKILHNLKKLIEISDELSTIVQVTRVDTVPVGPSTARNYVRMAKQHKLLSKRKPIFKGTEGFLLGKTQKINVAFYENAVLGPLGILEQIFPAIGEVQEDGKLSYSALGRIKTYFGDLKDSDFAINEKEAASIDSQFLTFLLSDVPFLSREYQYDILANVPSRIQKFSKKYPNSIFNTLLEQLHSLPASEQNPLSRLAFYNTGKDAADIQTLRNIWELALDANSKDDVQTKETKELALDLVKYAYFSAGFAFSPYSFFHLVPPYFWTDAYAANNPDINLLTNGKTVNVLLDSRIKQIRQIRSSENKAQDTLEAGIIKRFMEQYFRNNGMHSSLFPQKAINKKAAVTLYPTEFAPYSLEKDELKENEVVVISRAEKGGLSEDKKVYTISVTKEGLDKSLADFIAHAQKNPSQKFIMPDVFFKNINSLKTVSNLKFNARFRKHIFPLNIVIGENNDPRLFKDSAYNAEAGIFTINFSSYTNEYLIRTNSQMNNEEMYPQFVVGTVDKNKAILFKRIGNPPVARDKNGILVKTQVQYQKVSTLGTQHFILEYDLNNDIDSEQSVRDRLLEKETADKNVPKIDTPAAKMEAVTKAPTEGFVPYVSKAKKEVPKETKKETEDFPTFKEFVIAVNKWNANKPKDEKSIIKWNNETEYKRAIENNPEVVRRKWDMAKNC